MAQRAGYVVVRDAAPRDLCELAAREIADAQVETESPGLLEYRPTDTCREIVKRAQESLQAAALQIRPLGTSIKPVSVKVAKLRKIDSARMTGAPGSIYYTIALTQLDSASGWYSFPQVHEPSMVSSWQEEELNPGDSILWRGECIGKPGAGEGGIMLVVMFHSE